MMYTIARDVPPPTFEQLGREIGCCVYCKSDQPLQTKIIPNNFREGMEQITELSPGDAMDGPVKMRNIFGLAVKNYDIVNKTKHELYIVDGKSVRAWRLK